MVNSLDKLVSDIIEQIDYDLWKEIYLYKEEDEFDNQVRDLIKDWYNTTVEKEYG